MRQMTELVEEMKDIMLRISIDLEDFTNPYRNVTKKTVNNIEENITLLYNRWEKLIEGRIGK